MNSETALKELIEGNEYYVNADKTALLEQAVTANVSRSVLGLTSRSVILKELIDQDKLKIVGVEYSLETGQVEFHIT